jgi:hypothetical protein
VPTGLKKSYGKSVTRASGAGCSERNSEVTPTSVWEQTWPSFLGEFLGSLFGVSDALFIFWLASGKQKAGSTGTRRSNPPAAHVDGAY